MLPKFGNATFFLITLTAMVDFLAGISLRARRPRRVAAPVYAEPAPHYHPAPAPAPAAVTPPPAPVTPAAPVPPATSVAESVLTEKAEPKIERIEPKPERIEPKIETPVAPEVVAHTSPQITSPDLQPDSTTEKPKS